MKTVIFSIAIIILTSTAVQAQLTEAQLNKIIGIQGSGVKPPTAPGERPIVVTLDEAPHPEHGKVWMPNVARGRSMTSSHGPDTFHIPIEVFDFSNVPATQKPPFKLRAITLPQKAKSGRHFIAFVRADGK